MSDRDRLLSDLDDAQQRIHSLLATLDANQELYPGWTPSQFVAHLTGWEDAVIDSLHAFRRGDTPPTPAERGIDFYNSQTVLEREGLALEQILTEWQQARARLNELVESLSEAEVQQQFVTPWGTTLALAAMIHVISHHEQQHADELEQLLGKRG